MSGHTTRSGGLPRGKSEATHPELASIRAKRPNTLLVGDGIDDADMVTNGHNAIRVRVLDPRSDEESTKQEEAKTFTRFEALIKSGSLDPIGELITAVV